MIPMFARQVTCFLVLVAYYTMTTTRSISFYTGMLSHVVLTFLFCLCSRMATSFSAAVAGPVGAAGKGKLEPSLFEASGPGTVGFSIYYHV